MEGELQTVQARCLCGQAQHAITLPVSRFPLRTYICHCTSCRHHSGTLCLTMALMPRVYQPSEDTLHKLQGYQFSNRITQYWCSICGTKMFLRISLAVKGVPDTIIYGVPTGTLDRADGILAVLGHEHIQDTLDGGFSDFVLSISGTRLVRWPGDFDVDEQLPQYWTASDRTLTSPQEGDRLRGYCKCGSVEFWIARPSSRSKQAGSAWPDLLIPYGSSTATSSQGEAWWLRDSGKRFMAGVCSCDTCRLAAGMEWVEWAFVPIIDISLDADGTKPFSFDACGLASYCSSSGTKRFFCRSCGAMAFWDSDERQGLIDVAVGLLDAPEGARAETWLEWVTQRVSFREDAVKRAESLVVGLEEGLATYRKHLEKAD